MKNKLALVLSTACVVSMSLMAGGCSPKDASKEPPKQPAGKSQIARGGEERDESMENRENRASENGNTQREANLENRQGDAETRQQNR